tara:strand:+ start:242 stop:565 length:324 start_codon:yes stop_codon:yes gene_type:complete
MKLPKDTTKGLRSSIEERSQPKVDTRTDVTTTNFPDIKTLNDGQMIVNSGSGYVRSRNNLNRMLMVDVESMSTVEYYDGGGTNPAMEDLANKLNEVIEALKLIGAIE